MNINRNQAGVAHVALILVIVVLAAVGFVGYKVYDGSKVTAPAATNVPASQEASEESVPEAPEIKSEEDLTKAEQTLDQIDPGSSGDASELDSQSSDF